MFERDIDGSVRPLRDQSIVRWIILAMLVFSAVSAPISALSQSVPNEESIETRSLTSAKGVHYTLTLTENGTLSVAGDNKQDRRIPSGFTVRVDDRSLFKERVNFSAGETRTWSFDTNRGLDVVQDNHTITFSTFGNTTTYSFAREIESANADEYPTPYISDVTVTNGIVDGDPSSVTNITIVNHGPQLYGMKLLVNTEGTDGSFYGASIPSFTNETFTVELLEPRGDRIAGEARLYVDRPRKTEGALDQVEFVGSTDSNTEQWNTSYEPVRGPWLDDSYEYENESIRTDADARENLNPFDDPERRKYVNAVALTAAALLALLVARKLNRPS